MNNKKLIYCKHDMGSFVSLPENVDSYSPTNTYDHLRYSMRQCDEYRRQNDDIVRENKLLKQTIEQLKKEQKQLGDIVKTLNNPNNAVQQKKAIPTTRALKTPVNKEKIAQFVEHMLENPDINIYGFPDAIEKQIYRNVFSMLLNVLDYTLETTNIQLLGHKIVFELEPVDSESAPVTQEPMNQ